MKKKTKKKKKLSIRDRARRYASLGWLVVPMHSVKDKKCSCSNGAACEHPGKHPRTAHGVKDATTSQTQVEEWWEKWSRANIGIATRQESGILVLDIDPRHGGVETLKEREAELGPLPDTVTANTGGGGQHRIFAHPPFLVRKDTAGKLFGNGIDVLSDGCIRAVEYARRALCLKEHRLIVEVQEPFAAVIFCTADPNKVDFRTRSKWSRVLRYAAEFKGLEESLADFIKRKGGINKCAARFTRHLGRDSAHQEAACVLRRRGLLRDIEFAKHSL